MILNRFQIDNLRRGMPCNNTNGGGGSSSSSSSTTTQNFDKRVAVDTGIGLSSDSSTVTINALDGGAVNASLDFANKQFGTAALVANNSVIGALETVDRGAAREHEANVNALDFANKSFGAAATVANNALVGALDTVDRDATRSIDFARSVFESGLSVLGTAGKQVEAQTTLLAKAYDNAKGDGTEKQTLMYVALAAVAVVAVATVWGSK